MKKNWFYLTLMLVALAFVGCSDDEEYVEPMLDVTPNNLAGEWMLESFSNGQPVAEGSYLYMELKRKDCTFTIYNNLDSYHPATQTGAFYIEIDPELGAIVRGIYDFGGGDWHHRYVVRSLTADKMVWVAMDDEQDVSVYVRAEIPETIR